MNAERWIILGDSIQSLVYSAPGIAGDQSFLTAAQLPMRVNVSINNLSSPGARMTDGGQLDFGAASNKNAIKMIHGYAGAKGIIITLGTNDWSNPGTTAQSLLDSYRGVIQYCKALGQKVVVVPPIPRHDALSLNPLQHIDGSYTFAQFQYWIGAVAQEQAAIMLNAPATFTPSLTCYVDGVHLNAGGHDAFTDWLIAQMNANNLWI